MEKWCLETKFKNKRERERNEECNITTGKQRCFPLSLFLSKIRKKKNPETEDLSSPPLSSVLMALGQENGRDLGACSHLSISSTLPWLSWAATSPWGSPGPVSNPGYQRSCPLTWCPSSCFSLGNNFPSTFPPTTVSSVHPLGTDSAPRTLPSPSKCRRSQQDWCWETADFPNSLGEAEETREPHS